MSTPALSVLVAWFVFGMVLGYGFCWSVDFFVLSPMRQRIKWLEEHVGYLLQSDLDRTVREAPVHRVGTGEP